MSREFWDTHSLLALARGLRALGDLEASLKPETAVLPGSDACLPSVRVARAAVQALYDMHILAVDERALNKRLHAELDAARELPRFTLPAVLRGPPTTDADGRDSACP